MRGSRECIHEFTQRHLLTVLRYIERNPLRAELVARAEDSLVEPAGVGIDNRVALVASRTRAAVARIGLVGERSVGGTETIVT